MTAEERDAFLQEQKLCRVATVSAQGRPHASTLWYLWHGGSLWLYSLSGSQRWRDLQRDPRISVVVDAGEAYAELRGVELGGRAEPVGDVPRSGEKLPDQPELEEVERLYMQRYSFPRVALFDGRHAWLRVTPDRQYTWDFRKLPRA